MFPDKSAAGRTPRRRHPGRYRIYKAERGPSIYRVLEAAATGRLDKLCAAPALTETYATKVYSIFGMTKDQQGRVINCGLIEQKEGSR